MGRISYESRNREQSYETSFPMVSLKALFWGGCLVLPLSEQMTKKYSFSVGFLSLSFITGCTKKVSNDVLFISISVGEAIREELA